MKVTQIKYGTHHDYDVFSKEIIEITVLVEDTETEQEAFNRAKKFVQDNMSSLDKLNQLYQVIDQKRHLARELDERIEKLENKLKSIKQDIENLPINIQEK